jgi:thiol-disulfide isomerase/thioredoxin
MSERNRGTVRAPEFPAGLEWLNTERPLTLAALRGKVVILDFWTYCCINCQHVLPQLRRLEERFPNELAVIGVHSAKFTSEEETYNVRAAVMRHDIRHPVVNDRAFVMWRAYAVRAWPTIVIIDPDGKVIGGHSGEFDAAPLGDLIGDLIAKHEAAGGVDRTPLRLLLEKQKQPDTLLSFPG